MSKPSPESTSTPGADTGPHDRTVLRLHSDDNVAIARINIAAGTAVVPDLAADAQRADVDLVAGTDIPAGHKIALTEIAEGDAIIRYGQPIGVAAGDIRAGDHVHTHNVTPKDADRDFAIARDAKEIDQVPVSARRTFMGFRRSTGRVGTRNFITVVSTVNCSAHTCREIAAYFTPKRLKPYPNVDGVAAITHGYGCATGERGTRNYVNMQRALAGMVSHPNVGASVLVGLGCETNQMGQLIEEQNLSDPSRSPIPPVGLTIQETGGVAPTIEAGVSLVEKLLPQVNQAHRTREPISELMIALECGGSDGWSGITANPLVGRTADEIVRQGGTVVLSETAEIHGAEHLLTRRAVSEEVGRKLLDRLAWWQEYLARHGGEFDDNPSPGNKAGGLTNIVEKSLGAIAKAGTTNLVNVYEYADQVGDRGFVFMDSPGYDPTSVTGKVAGGCNLVLFTTGRGSVFGFKPSPCIKISTNSETYNRMIGDMDINAGALTDGIVDMETASADLLNLIVAVSSGTPSKSERQNIGSAEFVPWQPDGVA